MAMELIDNIKHVLGDIASANLRTMPATAKAAKDSGLASAQRGHMLTATVSTSSLKPTPWRDASPSASHPKSSNNRLGRSSQPAQMADNSAVRHFCLFRGELCL
jgi:hypothetical protein